ncbi:MAG TPA: DUF2235 domain-containing protein [Baekduia sp.]|uniref:DUF2235 domain-containing protein n=1 Tax=Baekduia sp. TaxID=2600305 RepID=UPI002D790071|nr:DUF2235 domain-containing protein [Baekduia sp.]HET6508774.1 DUF2235 domain-containing protein [Baekduia sp.]
MKRIAILCDGTWNRPDQVHDGVACPTNVVRLHRALPSTAADGVTQLPFYERGVGTGRFDRLSGGMFGFGLSRNVRACHAFLTDHYDPGDELYLFGFSRGAFTARSLGGLIGNSGIVRPEHRNRLDEAYKIYQDRGDPTKKPSGVTATAFRKAYAYSDVTPIRFIGVFDTVGALGIPLRIAALTKRWSFHDVRLGAHVATAVQALAIDERRGPFLPTLWQRQLQAPPTQQLHQVWFSGVHSDVGGGYPDHRLGDLALRWMSHHANEAGLDVQPSAQPDALAPQHESYRSFYRLTKPRPRKLVGTEGGAASDSSWRRMRELPGYHPDNLRAYLATDPPHADA